MPSRDSIPVERSTVSAIVCAAPSLDVDQLVLADPLVGDGQPPGRDETAAPAQWAGRIRPTRPSAVRPRGHDRERALGVRLRAGLGERQVHAQAVVAARVDEAGRDPDGGLVRPHLHVGLDLDDVLAHPRL